MFILARLRSPSLSHTPLRSSRHTHTQRPPYPSDIRLAMSWASLQPPARPTPKRCSLASCELSRVSDCLAVTLGAPSHSPIARELAVLISGRDQYLKPSRSDAIATCCSESFVHASCLQQGLGRPRLGSLSHRDRPLAQPYTNVVDGRETLLPSVHGHNASIVSSRTRSYIVLVTCPRSSHLIDIATSWSTGWD